MDNSARMTLREYFANHGLRRFETIIEKWFRYQDKTNPKKTKGEWDEVVKSFFSETERK